MRATHRTLKSLMAAVLVACTLGVFVASPATAATTKPWATVNVCNTPKFPYTVGVRASMPSGPKGSAMVMRIKLQYRLGTETEWREVLRGGDTGKLKVGTSKGATRQAGSNFKFDAPAAGVTFTFRGQVEFEWLVRGKRVKRSKTTTTANHPAKIGSDPLNYSDAVCEMVGAGPTRPQ